MAIQAVPSGHAPATPKRREILAWMLYDFANTAYTVMIVTFVYGIYFKNVVCQGRPWGDFLWGLNATISLTLVALSAPILGAMADHARGKKFFLMAFSLLCIVFSGALFFVKEGMIATGMFLFIVANIGFQGSLVFYNAFLPELASESRMNLISGLGWGVGYVGAIIIVAISGPFLRGGFAEENLFNVRLTFVLQAVFYLVFSIPIFIWLKDRGLGPARLKPDRELIRAAFVRLGVTFRSLRHYRELFKFLVAYFIYIEGVTTVIYFSTIYASDTLGFTLGELILFFILVQSAGIVGALGFGWLGDRFGPRRTVAVTLVLWFGVTVAAYFSGSKEVFWWIGAAAGVAMGASQCVSRSMMAMMTPRAKVAEFFWILRYFWKNVRCGRSVCIRVHIRRKWEPAAGHAVRGSIFSGGHRRLDDGGRTGGGGGQTGGRRGGLVHFGLILQRSGLRRSGGQLDTPWTMAYILF